MVLQSDMFVYREQVCFLSIPLNTHIVRYMRQYMHQLAIAQAYGDPDPPVRLRGWCAT